MSGLYKSARLVDARLTIRLLGDAVVHDNSILKSGLCHVVLPTGARRYPRLYLEELKTARIDLSSPEAVREFNANEQGKDALRRARAAWDGYMKERALDCRRKGWLAASDVGLILGVSGTTVGSWKNEGVLSFETEGKFFFIKPETLLAAVKWVTSV